jgi:ubiquinone/menaquinone biosynthesis C-methylase UbiE
MQRTLEPEIMDDREQSIAYANADFSSSNQWIVDHLVADYPHALRNVIDIGCCPCDVMLRLAAARPDIHVTAIDGSAAMIELAGKVVRAARHEARIVAMQGYMPGLAVQDHSFDAILSKDPPRHLPDPLVLWNEARRLGRQDAAIYVMDLIRPATRECEWFRTIPNLEPSPMQRNVRPVPAAPCGGRGETAERYEEYVYE